MSDGGVRGTGPEQRGPERGAPASELGAAVTDALVGLEALAIAHALRRRRSGIGPSELRATEIRDAFVLFYTSTAVAALSGAALHGLFTDRGHPIRGGLWRISLAAIGLGSLAAWRLGASLALAGRRKQRVRFAADTAHAAYVAVVVLTGPPYAIAVASYVPGAAFLGWACTRRLNDPAERDGAVLGLAALGITAAAAAIQVLRIRVGPRWLDSNALYHLVQAGGLAMFHLAAVRLLDAAASSESYRPAM